MSLTLTLGLLCAHRHTACIALYMAYNMYMLCSVEEGPWLPPPLNQ